MSKTRLTGWIVRITLFALILSLGTLAALMAGETAGLALDALPGASSGTADNVLYAGVVDTPQATGIYRSDDSGQTWEVIDPGIATPINTVAVLPDNKAVLYAGGGSGPMATASNLWRSDDGGQSWRKYGLNLPATPDGVIPAVTALAVDPDQPQALYVGTDGQGVYRFSNEIGYEVLGDISLRDAHVKSITMGADDRVYALTNKGLFVTTGQAWQQLETVPEVPVSLGVSKTDPDLLYAGGPSSGVYRSTDGGQAWEAINDGLDLIPGAALRVTALEVDGQNAQHVAVATAYGLGSQLAPAAVYESQDAGDHWTKVTDVEEVVTELTFDQGLLYATSSAGVARYGQTEIESGPAASVITDKPAVNRTPVDLRPLASPNAMQTIILILTVILAGLVLVGRLEWLVGLWRRRRSSIAR